MCIAVFKQKTFYRSDVRTVTPSNIQFVNATTSNTTSATVRPIIFHQKTATTNQPQLLTVMPAGVRLQQLAPVVRPTANQAATIVRLMTPVTSSIRPGATGQQQIIQLNTTKQQQTQQQPLVIKAIAASGANRPQQQPILLTTTTAGQQKAMLGHSQPQQLLLLNQNAFNNNNNNNQGSQTKITLQMANVEQGNISTMEPNQTDSSSEKNLPQLDGNYLVESLNTKMTFESTYEAFLNCSRENNPVHSTSYSIPQLDGSIDEQVSHC